MDTVACACGAGLFLLGPPYEIILYETLALACYPYSLQACPTPGVLQGFTDPFLLYPMQAFILPHRPLPATLPTTTVSGHGSHL